MGGLVTSELVHHNLISLPSVRGRPKRFAFLASTHRPGSMDDGWATTHTVPAVSSART